MSELYVWIRSLWMVWLFILFVGACVWAILPRNREKLEEQGRIPFKDDDDAEPRP